MKLNIKKHIFFTLALLFTSNLSFGQTQEARLENTETFEFESDIIGETYQISVALPFDYKSGEKNYKTLYVLDANVTFGMVRDIQTLISFEPGNPPLIVIGVGYKSLNEWIQKRSRDYKPNKESLQDVGNFLSFLSDELVPHIEKLYHTDGEKLLYGHSSAGLVGLYAMTQNSDFFDGYIMTSPSVDEDNGTTINLLKNASLHFVKPTRLYISIGSKEKQSFQTAYLGLLDILKESNSQNLKWNSGIVEATHMESMAPAFIKGLQFVNKKD